MRPGIRHLRNTERRMERAADWTELAVKGLVSAAVLATWALLAALLVCGILGCGEWSLPAEPDTMHSDHPAVEHTTLGTVKAAK